jgi:hypothetical protein
MDPEFGLEADAISSTLLRAHGQGTYNDVYTSLYRFFLIASPCLSVWPLEPEGARKIEEGEFRNALYDKMSGLVFMNVSTGYSSILPCWLEALHCTDFSKPYPGGWHPSHIGPWNYIELFSSHYIDRGHGLFLPEIDEDSMRLLLHSRGFSWTVSELSAFGRYTSQDKIGASPTLSK